MMTMTGRNKDDGFFGSALVLTAICVAIFFLSGLFPVMVDSGVLVSSRVSERPWTIITHVFLHADAKHLYFNMFALALFGLILEKYIGTRNFLIVFFGSAIVSSIADIAFYPATLGASGAVFGLLGCLAVIRPKQVVWALGIPMYIIVTAFIWVMIDLTGMFYPDNIAHAAHLFGMGFGIVMGFFWRDGHKAPRKPDEPASCDGKEEVISERELDEWERKYMGRPRSGKGQGTKGNIYIG